MNKINRIFAVTALVLSSIGAFGQAVRVDIPIQTSGPTVAYSQGYLPQALWMSNSAVYICAHPSTTLAACQSYPITTYTDSTESTTCPAMAQMVQLPGNTCTASSSVTSNVGFWYAGGIVDYWVVSAYGTYGPLSVNNSSSGSTIDLQTNGTDNAVQTKLNLIAGTNTTLNADSAGGVTINSTGGSSGVQYNPTTTQYFMIGDSRLINDSAGATDMTVTAASCDGTTCTFTGTNTPAVGTYVIPWWTFSPSCLSGAFGPILTSTSTQVTMAQSGSYCTGTQTGTGGYLAIRNYVAPALAQKEPFFKNHGTVQLLAQTSYGGGTVYDWDTGFSTLLSPKLTACLATAGPCYLTISLGFDDLFADSPDACSSTGTLEGSVTTTGSFRKLFNEVHQLGAVKIIVATEPTRMSSSVYCTNTPQDAIALNQWLVTMAGSGNETSGYLDYADSVIDTATAMGSPSDNNFNGVHYSNAGGQTFADALNSGMSSQGSWNLGQPASVGPNVFTGQQIIRNPAGTSTGNQLGFADDGSLVPDFWIQDYVGIGAFTVAGNWASSWRWNNSTMYQQMPSNGGYCFQTGTGGPYGDADDTCLWRKSANVFDLGNGTWKDSSGTLGLANVDLTAQTTDPASPVNGQMWYNSTSGLFKFYQGGAIETLGGSGSMTWPTYTGLTKYSGSSSWATPIYTDVTALWATCTSGWLKFDGTCSTPGGGGSVSGAFGRVYTTGASPTPWPVQSATSGTFASPNTAGNLLVVNAYNKNTAISGDTISDTAGDTWTFVGTPTTLDGGQWYTCNAVGGANVVTVTGAAIISVAEYTGNATSSCLDTFGYTNLSGSQTAISATTSASVSSSDIVVASIMTGAWLETSAVTIDLPSGYAQVSYSAADGSFAYGTMASYVQTAYQTSGTASVSFTMSNTHYPIAIVSAYKTSIPSTVSASLSPLSNGLLPSGDSKKCSSTASPAVCGSSTSGTVQVPAGATTLTVNTSSVTTASSISYSYTTAFSGCSTPANITSLLQPYTSAVTTWTSFTITLPIAPTTNPACVQFTLF